MDDGQTSTSCSTSVLTTSGFRTRSRGGITPLRAGPVTVSRALPCCRSARAGRVSIARWGRDRTYGRCDDDRAKEGWHGPGADRPDEGRAPACLTAVAGHSAAGPCSCQSKERDRGIRSLREVLPTRVSVSGRVATPRRVGARLVEQNHATVLAAGSLMAQALHETADN
jgi:hypothetical protein